MTRPFVKSADTSTSASNSRSALDEMLRRYGATAIATSEDIAKREIVVTFIIPNSTAKDAPRVPVKLPISVAAVYDVLYGRPTRRGYDEVTGQFVTTWNPGGYDAKRMAQAERVAWRNLVLWVDAALSASAVGLQTVTEAFFAHAIVGANGERMSEVVAQFQSELGGGVQRLLTSTTENP